MKQNRMAADFMVAKIVGARRQVKPRRKQFLHALKNQRGRKGAQTFFRFFKMAMDFMQGEQGRSRRKTFSSWP